MTDVLDDVREIAPRPPRDDLVRAMPPAPILRERTGPDGEERPVLYGYLARFDEWTEIDSAIEGHFMERIRPRSFTKTFQSPHRDRIRCLLNHGRDPFIGLKPLGPIETAEERDEGAYYEVPLLPTSYNADLIPGFKEGLYGSSFRFRVIREEYVQRPGKSDHNPDGIPERSVVELECYEFGPVTFSAYLNATAGLRSLTDELAFERLAESDPERLEELVAIARSRETKGARKLSVKITGSYPEGTRALPAIADAVDSEFPETANVTVDFGNGDTEVLEGVQTFGEWDVTSVDPLSREYEPDVEEIERSRYERAIGYFRSTAWAMHPSTLAAGQAIMAERASGYRPTAEEIAERLGDHTRDEDREDRPAGPVAVLRLVGAIFPKASSMSLSTAGTDLESFRERLREAVADDSVKAILLDVDSPGGSVELVQETFAELLDARSVKPIVAVANTWAASAAYYLAAAATELIVTPSGEVGSIGVYAAHEDWSKYDEALGVDTTLISAGKYKVEGNPFEPLSDEAREEMQSKVDAHYEMFIKAVAKGRDTSVGDVRENFGQGRMLMPPAALTAGMVDRVATYEETLARLTKQYARSEEIPEVAQPPEDGETRDAGETHLSRSVEGDAGGTHLAEPSTHTNEGAGMTTDELRARQREIQARMTEIASENVGKVLDAGLQSEWDQLGAEFEANKLAIEADDRRMAQLAAITEGGDAVSRVDGGARAVASTAVGAGIRRVPSDPFDFAAYRRNTPDEASYAVALRDGAKMILEGATFPHPNADRETNVEHINALLDVSGDEDSSDLDASAIARRIVLTGSPLYRKAFGKYLANAGLTSAEQSALAAAERALNIGTDSLGGYAIPFTLDPTVILTSDGSVNPLRAISRVERITGNEWRGVTSAGITASYDPEAQEVSDDTPTLGQPTASVAKAQAFVPFSIEVGQDWGSMQSEMARLLGESKDDLEAEKFMTGDGTDEPEGLLVGATESVVTVGAGAFADDDLFALEAALPERFLARASILGSRFAFTKVRQFDTNGGAAFWVDLRNGLPPSVIGYPAYIATALDASLVGGSQIMVIGDFSKFLIVDRVGLNIELVPHLMGANRRPTGQRGLYAYWRNTTKVLVPGAFRVLVIAT